MSESTFVPSGPMRPNAIYTSWRLHKALGLVARKTGHTREDIAEKVLGGWIAQQHPEIESWMATREKEERDFMAKLKRIPVQEAEPDSNPNRHDHDDRGDN